MAATPTTSTGKLTASELKAFEFRLSKARTRLVIEHPFWAVIVLRRTVIVDYTVPTAAMTATQQIYVNPSWAKDFTVPQLMFLLAHEAGHDVFGHLYRRGNRKPGKWNRAGDAVINDMLIQCNVGEFIEGGVNMPGSMQKTTDAVYNLLPDEPDDDGPGGIGNDIIEGAPGDGASGDAREAQARVELAQAAQVARMAGKLPGVLEQLVASILHVPTPWYEILERYMSSLAQASYTWARPNRRYIDSGIYLPNTGHTPTMGTVVVQIDVSGSISKKELDHYNGHLARIIADCRPAKVHVIYTDTQVQKHMEFEADDEVTLAFYSGGGTHMPAGFDWVAAQGIEPDVFVCLTDGYTDFGSETTYPVIWCISSDKVATHGVTVPFKLED